MVLSVPRETNEFNEVVVEIDGEQKVSGVELSIVPEDGTSRPTEWADPVVRGGKIGFMITGMQPGSYRVYARISDSGDGIVRQVGGFVVS